MAGRSFHLQTHWLAAALAATWRYGQTPLNQLRAPHRFALLGFWLMVRSWTTEPLLESLESPKLIRLCHLCLRDRFASEQGLQQPLSFQFHHSVGLSSIHRGMQYDATSFGCRPARQTSLQTAFRLFETPRGAVNWRLVARETNPSNQAQWIPLLLGMQTPHDCKNGILKWNFSTTPPLKFHF